MMSIYLICMGVFVIGGTIVITVFFYRMLQTIHFFITEKGQGSRNNNNNEVYDSRFINSRDQFTHNLDVRAIIITSLKYWVWNPYFKEYRKQQQDNRYSENGERQNEDSLRIIHTTTLTQPKKASQPKGNDTFFHVLPGLG